MDKKNEEKELISLDEIKNFQLDENEINDLNSKLDENFLINDIIYYEQTKKIKFKGTIIDKEYEGRGILYSLIGNDYYIYKNGYFKNGKLEGFGRYTEYKGKTIIGFFKNDICIKGIIKNNNIKEIEFKFNPDEKSVIGIEFYPNGNIKRKMEYEYKYRLISKNYSNGILYDEINNIIYSWLLKDFKPKEANNINIYNKYGKKIYYGNILNYKYHGKGIENYKNSEIAYFDGIFNDGDYDEGIIYDPNGKKIYEGKFMNNNPIISKNIKLFNLDGTLLYEGDLLDGMYYNYGKMFDDHKLIYEGGFLKGKYNNFGKQYKGDKLLYEGEFLEGLYHGYGKLIGKYEGNFSNGLYEGKGIIYKNNSYIKAIFKQGVINDDNVQEFRYSCLGEYLFFEGSIINNEYNGYGKIYYINKNLYYQGNFIEGEIKGKGVKYYENGVKKIEGIFNKINECKGIYYNPKGDKIYEGVIIDEIPFNGKNLIVYDDNTNKIFEGDIKNGKYEGYGIEYFNLIKDKILYEGFFENNYYQIEDLNYDGDKEINIFIYSFQIGHLSCEFVEQFLNDFFHSETEGEKIFNFEYRNIKFKTSMIYRENRNGSINFWEYYLLKCSKIIILVIEIDEYTDIDYKYYKACEYIKIFKSKNQDALIYIIVSGKNRSEDMGKFFKSREKAKELIINGKIDKYYIFNLKTNDRAFENIKKNLIIDYVQIYIKNQQKFSKNKILFKYLNF